MRGKIEDAVAIARLDATAATGIVVAAAEGTVGPRETPIRRDERIGGTGDAIEG